MRLRPRLFAKPANPRPFPLLAPLGGNFVNPSFGVAKVSQDGDALIMQIAGHRAVFKLEPWDGDIFIARLMPTGRFGPIVDLGYMTRGFAQFQMDKDGKLTLLRLTSGMVKPMSSGGNRGSLWRGQDRRFCGLDTAVLQLDHWRNDVPRRSRCLVSYSTLCPAWSSSVRLSEGLRDAETPMTALNSVPLTPLRKN